MPILCILCNIISSNIAHMSASRLTSLAMVENAEKFHKQLIGTRNVVVTRIQ